MRQENIKILRTILCILTIVFFFNNLNSNFHSGLSVSEQKDDFEIYIKSRTNIDWDLIITNEEKTQLKKLVRKYPAVGREEAILKNFKTIDKTFAENIALDFLKENIDLLAKQQYLTEPSMEFKVLSVEEYKYPQEYEERGGDYSVVISQVYNGIRVFEATMLATIDQYGQIFKVRNDFIENIRAPAVPSITSTQALHIAQSVLNTTLLPYEGPTQTIYGQENLAWHFNFSKPVFKELLIDALTGEVLLSRKNVRDQESVKEKKGPKREDIPDGPRTPSRLPLYIPNPLVGNSDSKLAVKELAEGWETIINEGFAYGFPTGAWNAFSGVTGQPFWDDEYFDSGYRLWCCGSDPFLDPSTDSYPNNMSAWAIYGPFDLTNTTDAQLIFDYWFLKEADYDDFGYYVSVNGVNFYGYHWLSSSSSGGWQNNLRSMTDWYTLGNLCGESQVWVAFLFESDGAVVDRGAFLDNVKIEKYVGPEYCTVNITARDRNSLPLRYAWASYSVGGAVDWRQQVNSSGIASNSNSHAGQNAYCSVDLNGTRIRVYDEDNGNAIVSKNSGTFDSNPNTTITSIITLSDAAGMNNAEGGVVFREMMRAWEYSSSSPFSFDRPRATVYIDSSAGPSSSGTAMWFPHQRAVLDNGPPSSSSLIDDTMLHEYAHAMQYAMYGNSWGRPPGCTCDNHGGTSNDCSHDALIEGWAEYYPLSVYRHYNSNDSSYGWSNSSSEYNIETNSNTNIEERDEWSFAGVLWDICDSNNEGNDRLSLGEDEIWSVMRMDNPRTVEEFFQDFCARYPTHATNLERIYKDHGMHPDWLTLNMSTLDFGSASNSENFTIRRLGWYGDGVILNPTWTITENVPWITNINPLSGSTTTETDTITVTVSRAGLSAGTHQGIITITPSEYGLAQTILVSIEGNATQPILTVTPTERYVSPEAGTTTFAVSNTGTGTMNWTATVTRGESWLSIQSGSSGTNSGTITAAYTENTSGQSYIGVIQVTAPDAQGSPINVGVYQAGVPPNLSVMPDSRSVPYNAGTTTFDVSNTRPPGPDVMLWTASVISGGSWLSIQSGSSGDESGTITAAFTQNSSTSPRQGTIRVTAPNATGSPKDVIVFQGGISMQPEIRVTMDDDPVPDGEGVDFGSHMIGTTTDRTFVVANTGSANLTLSGSPYVSITGPDAGQYSVVQQPTSPIAPGNNTTFVIRFSPTTQGGKTASISLANNDSNENPYDIALFGIGLPAVKKIVYLKKGDKTALDHYIKIHAAPTKKSERGVVLASDFWSPNGDTRDMTTLDIDGDGKEEIAYLKKGDKTALDFKLLIYTAPTEKGERGTLIASDFWSCNGDTRDIAALDIDGDGKDEIAYLKKGDKTAQDYKLYIYSAPTKKGERGTLLASDFWGCNGDDVDIAAVDIDGDGKDEIAYLKKGNKTAEDYKLLIHAAPTKKGERGAFLASDFWSPNGNEVSISSIDLNGDDKDEIVYLKKGSGSPDDWNIYIYTVPTGKSERGELLASDFWSSNGPTKDHAGIII